MRFGIVLDELFTRHCTPEKHPECPDRIRSISRKLTAWEEFSDLEKIPPSRAEEESILLVHTEGYFQRLRKTAGVGLHQIALDTYVGPESFEIALAAAGSVISLVDRLLSGRIDAGFAAVRPPGHHAESDRAMGFCLFNNVAVAAEWAIRLGEVQKIAIIDFDVHHGNGTQRIFYSRPDVLYISTHQFPFYPGTGQFTEVGKGEGRGFNVNLPISAGMGNYFYLMLYTNLVIPILREFQPQLILVSAGYDGHWDDPLAGMNLDTSGFGHIISLLNSVAEQVCDGRILYVLEGGYNLKVLPEAVLITLSNTFHVQRIKIEEERAGLYVEYQKKMSQFFSSYWKILR